MYSRWRTTGKVYYDRTGAILQLPVIHTDQGPFWPLIHYFKDQYQTNGISSFEHTIHAVGKFLDYLNAHLPTDRTMTELFSDFTTTLFSGSIDENGHDNSKLFWKAPKKRTSNTYYNALMKFFVWVQNKYNTEEINPITEASRYEYRIQYAAWLHKKSNSFFSHLLKPSPNQFSYSHLVKKAKHSLGLKSIVRPFPETNFEHFIINGFLTEAQSLSNIRDALIVTLIHGTGIRISEALSLFRSDIIIPRGCETGEKYPIIHFYDPEDGQAPFSDILGKNQTRAQYLKSQFGLLPRNKIVGTAHLGAKSRAYEYSNGSSRMYWSSTKLSIMFTYLWKLYLFKLEEEIYKYPDCVITHPYVFMVFKKEYKFSLYKKKTFQTNYKKALERINLVQNPSLGYGPHCHRHAYKKRLKKLGFNALLIQRAMHQTSIESQNKYGLMTPEELNNEFISLNKDLNKDNLEKESLKWKNYSFRLRRK
ncbi:MAG: gamma-mobile-trio recombinase GmtY [Lentisphaeraceae bacterium]|nr:gamma-mobile-trio recombinase GmtY [Lentisphaeraceae bacterium]